MNEKILGLMSKMLERGAEKAYQADDVPSPHKIIENVSYVNDDMAEHKLDIIYPNETEDKYPFIVNIHGGGFGMNSKDKLYRNYGMRLAEDKFAVVNINFRLSTNHKFPAQIHDVLAAIKFIKNNADKYNLDMNNMFLAGDSSGAYMAMLTACIFNDVELREYYELNYDVKIRGVAANCGMYDFHTFMGKDVRFPMKGQIVEMLFGTADYEELVSFKYSSVLQFINEDFPPVYFMDTENQSFAAEAYRLEKVLKEKKIPYEMHIFKKSDKLMHAFNIMSKYEQSSVVLKEIFEFFGQYVDSKKDDDEPEAMQQPKIENTCKCAVVEQLINDPKQKGLYYENIKQLDAWEKEGIIELYAGDSYLDDIPMHCEKEDRLIISHYYRCQTCGKVFFIGTCCRGSYVFKVSDNDLSQIDFEHTMSSNEQIGVYFDNPRRYRREKKE